MTTFLLSRFRRLGQQVIDAWNRFWFTPQDARLLASIRIVIGSLLVFSHVAAFSDLDKFFAHDGWLPLELLSESPRAQVNLTWLSYINEPGQLLMAHSLVLGIYVCFAAGLCTQVVAPLCLILFLSYINRNELVIYGFDQVMSGFLACLVVGRSGDRLSIDRWLQARNQKQASSPEPSVRTNVAIRLLQIKLCVIYFAAGYFKIVNNWFDGQSLWNALISYETSTWDLRWLAAYPSLIRHAALIVTLWELQFFIFIWPKRTRSIMLTLALGTHIGLALTTKLVAFSLLMLAGCAAFLAQSINQTPAKDQTHSKGHAYA